MRHLRPHLASEPLRGLQQALKRLAREIDAEVLHSQLLLASDRADNPGWHVASRPFWQT